MEKKCVTALMTHDELTIANAIQSCINAGSSLHQASKPFVLIHNAKDRALNPEDWQTYGRPHMLVLQDKIAGVDDQFDVFVDFGFGKIWTAEHTEDHTTFSPDYRSVHIAASSPLVFSINSGEKTFVVLDSCSSYYNAWHERYDSANWNRQINIAVAQ